LTDTPTPSWWKRHWPFLLILVATAIAYSPLWSVEFSWDDEALVKDNQVTHTLKNMGEFFTRDLWSTTRLTDLTSGYYRPFMLVSLALDRALFGLHAGWAHFHSLLWHLAAVSALYAILHRLFATPAALAGTALFALHPVNSEVMALVAARNDSMAAALVLLSIFLLLEKDVRPAQLVGAGVAALAALLSKESAVLAPLMLLALDIARWHKPGPWRRYIPLGGALGMYAGMRSWAGINHGIVPADGNLSLVMEHAPEMLSLYGQLLVWPWPLTPARHIYYLPSVGQTLLGALITLGIVGTLLKKGAHRGLVLGGLTWTILTFAPSLAATLDKGLLGERYLYLPIAGLGLALAAAIRTIPKWPIVFLSASAVLVLQIRLPDWQDSRAVWARAHQDAPSPYTAAGLAWYLHRDKDTEEAIALFTMALEGNPPYRDVCDLIVSAHLEIKEAKKAAEIGAWAIDERGCPTQGLIVNHTAVALAGIGQWDAAAKRAASHPRGVHGPGLVVVAAAQATKGDFATMKRMMAQNPSDQTFGARVAKLLRLGGANAASQQVVLMAREGAH